MTQFPVPFRKALSHLTYALDETPQVFGAFAHRARHACEAQGDIPDIAVYLHEEVWRSRTSFTEGLQALTDIMRIIRSLDDHTLRGIHFFDRTDLATYPAGVACILKHEALHLSGTPIHTELGWHKAGEATRLYSPTAVIQYWRSLAWHHGPAAFLTPEALHSLVTACRELVPIACAASGLWCNRDEAVQALERLHPNLSQALLRLLSTYQAWTAAQGPSETAIRLRRELLVFVADLSDAILPLLEVPQPANAVTARRSAAKSPAPVMTPQADRAALTIRNKLRSALLALLAVRTPLVPLVLVAVLDDLMPTPAVRLIHLPHPGADPSPPVLFLRQAELHLVGIGAQSEQFLYGEHFYPYLSTALIGGSRLLHGQEVRSALQAPNRAAAVLTTISDLQLHLRPRLMLESAASGVTDSHTARANREMAHLLALGLWLHEDDYVDTEHLQSAFFKIYPDFPYRDEVETADLSRDHGGWCWAWEATASWLRKRAEEALPPSLQGIVLPA